MFASTAGTVYIVFPFCCFMFCFAAKTFRSQRIEYGEAPDLKNQPRRITAISTFRRTRHVAVPHLRRRGDSAPSLQIDDAPPKSTDTTLSVRQHWYRPSSSSMLGEEFRALLGAPSLLQGARASVGAPPPHALFPPRRAARRARVLIPPPVCVQQFEPVLALLLT